MPNQTQPMDGKNLERIGDEASKRFENVEGFIDQVKAGIQANRNGDASITDISKDPNRLAKRIARESLPLDLALERINGVPNFQDILILKKIFKLSETVGRITIKNNYGTSGYGTGFVIAPGIIITNHHVFPDEQTAKQSYIQFNYELNDKGEPQPPLTFRLEPEKFFLTSSFEKSEAQPLSGLDFTIVALSDLSKEGKKLDALQPAKLDEGLGKILEGENCVVIQHPKGDYKKIVMKDIRMLGLADDFLIYESDTLPGSSGAMVVALGTGEVVALHHSGVPRKNKQGQWLRKDGGVVQEGDSDENIDWIGNEGVRISSIIRAIKQSKIPPHMKKFRTSILQGIDAKRTDDQIEKNQKEFVITADEPQTTSMQHPPSSPQADRTHVMEQAVDILQHDTNTDLAKPTNYFVVELSDSAVMQEDWKTNAHNLVKGLVSSEMLFPMSTLPSQKRLMYICVRSDDNTWEIAERLESLPQIAAATPDLPLDTDRHWEHTHYKPKGMAGVFQDVLLDGTAKWNETEFINKWNDSAVCFAMKKPMKNDDLLAMRRWNWNAINMSDKVYADKDITDNLPKIKLVHLDTGYTDHAKVKDGFDLDNDEDFLDGEDARDEMTSSQLLYPGHGTRSASILIGSSITSTFSNDGNEGLLTQKGKRLLKVIPYRIAQSVISIAREKNLSDAAIHAINGNADVLLLCFGTFPTPLLYEVARMAYENGVLWISAAGNRVETPVAPAIYPGTISVAAMNPANKPWLGSCYGDDIDIAAPGEDVYVPYYNKEMEEIMVYGDGTGYAATHVAGAAALWKAKHYKMLKNKYHKAWQVVEAFRFCLRNSANKLAVKTDNVGTAAKGSEPAMLETWDKNYGEGILDIAALLAHPLPEASILQNVYEDKPTRIEWDLGIKETVYSLWQSLVHKKDVGPESTSPEMELTTRARISIAALTAAPAASVFESYNKRGQQNADSIIKMYFDSYK